MNTRAQKLNINQMYVFWACIGIIALLVLMYVYFVNMAIFHTAERTRVEERITDVKSQISQLELELIDETRELTIDYAYTLGFLDVSEPTFVKRDQNIRVTLNE